jgi:hypothetical protein
MLFSVQKSFMMEYRVKTNDGSYRWVLEKTNRLLIYPEILQG